MQQGRIALCISISNDQFTSITGYQKYLRSTNMAARRGYSKTALFIFFKVKRIET